MKIRCARMLVLALLILATLAAAGSVVESQPAAFELIIRNGRVIDGAGNPFVLADVAVQDGRIVVVGQVPDDAGAARTIDARGLYVVPGFIDMHSHGGPAHANGLRSEHNSLMQGITTAVLNPDGGGMWPIAEHVARYRREPVGVNVVMMVGHNRIREMAMGMDQRPADAAELERMKQLLRQGLDEGAYGMTLGLEGTPGRWSDTAELIGLATVIAEYGGFFHTHQRAEGRSPRWWNASRPGVPVDGLEATRESIVVSERSGARVMATHFKILGKDFWGASDAALRLIDEARARGAQMYLDTYTYESYGNTANVALVPTWALVDDEVDVGGQDSGLAGRLDAPYSASLDQLRRRLEDPVERYVVRRDIAYEIRKAGGPEGVLVIEHPTAEYRGRTLEEIAALHGEDPVDAAIRLQLEGDPSRPGGGAYRGMNISEIDNEAIIQKPYLTYGTDGGVVPFGEGYPHPRYYGIYPRIIRQYVFDRHVISLPFAIRAMTSLAAQIIGLPERGLLREGYRADITVFDPVTIRPNSTYLAPHVYPTGIRYVVVNGHVAVDAGTLTDALAGMMLAPPWTGGARPAPANGAQPH